MTPHCQLGNSGKRSFVATTTLLWNNQHLNTKRSTFRAIFKSRTNMHFFQPIYFTQLFKSMSWPVCMLHAIENRFTIYNSASVNKTISCLYVTNSNYVPACSDINLALGRPTWQTSTYALSTPAFASNAVDGDRNPYLEQGSCSCTAGNFLLNSSSPGQNGYLFADDIFRCIFTNEYFCILIQISLKFVPEGPLNNNPALV